MAHQYPIPVRTSSKRASEKYTEKDELEKRELTVAINCHRKFPKCKLPPDARFCEEIKEYFKLQIKRVKL